MDITLPYRIFSVDPATTTSGWAMTEIVSIHPLKIRIHKFGTIEGQKLLRQKKEMSKLFSKQFCVVDALEDEYINLITEWNPHAVVSEGAFAHIHISAALALTLAIHALRRASYATLQQDLKIIPPTITKLALTGKGSADKDSMRYHFFNSTFLVDIPDRDNQEVTEHAIDAVGHSVGFCRRDIVGDIIQISAAEKRQSKREKEKRKKEREGT